MTDLLALIQQDVTLRKVSNRDGGEWAGPCPLCGGTDRFRCWPESSRTVKFWCRGCHLSGDEIEYLRKVKGVSFPDAARMVGKELDAPRPLPSRRVAQAEAETFTDYYRWEHEQLVKWTDAYRALLDDKEEAAIGYRATVRCPELYTEAEKDYWERLLQATIAALDEGAVVPTMADVFTYNEHREERYNLWLETKRRP